MLVVLAGVVAFATVAPFRAAVRTVAVLPELLELPVRPLSALTPEPQRTATTYGADRPDPLHVYVPADLRPGDRRGAVVLSLGIHPQPLDHPDVVRIASAISRVGVIVAVPDSSDLRASRITADEPHHLAEAVVAIAGRPDVDPSRIGLAGFSAGASMALIASADPLIAGRLSFVHGFGAYASAEVLLIDVATRTMADGAGVSPWSAEPGIRGDILDLLLAAIEEADQSADTGRLRTLLAPVVAAEAPPDGPDPAVAATLEDDSSAAYRLFTARSRADARAALRAASASLREHLAAISPLTVAGRLRSEVHLMHGLGDRAIPVTHAGMLQDAIPPAVLRRVTLFGRFVHEQPGRQGLGLEDVPDIWELFLHLEGLAERVAA